MRIRTIKPEFWKHPVMARLPADTQLLALSLLSLSDDEGYFKAEPAYVRGECSPFTDDLMKIHENLMNLCRVGWIELVKHDEQGQIGRVVKWTSHQYVQHPSPSKIKGYFGNQVIHETLMKVPETLMLDQGSGIRDQGREGKQPPSRLSILTAHKAVVSSRVPQSEWDDAIGKMNDSELEELLKLAKGSGKDGGIFPSDLEAAKVLLKEKREASKWKGTGKYI